MWMGSLGNSYRMKGPKKPEFQTKPVMKAEKKE